ncbi:MAG: prepilin-type N-terminal cleavage/methylation domain-containing protein [Polyangiaceae bacterium]|nr:prepilin-type N-terminal cleavage/methylation domain-containing protein [Polyangiaceae bacterium]
MVRSLPGFTLIEVMVVVSIIAIMAAVAAPSVIRIVQDRRSQRDALGLLAILQDAHGRALGRGAAVIVSYNEAPTGGIDTVDIRESLQDIDGVAPTGDLPNPSCSSGQGSGVLAFWQSGARERPTDVSLNLGGQSGIFVVPTASTQRLCFTPRGETRIKTSTGWARMTDSAQFTFTSSTTGNARFVYLYPNGIARLRI